MATIILVTHAGKDNHCSQDSRIKKANIPCVVKWLPYSDQVITMGHGGRILRSGSYVSLATGSDHLQELSMQKDLEVAPQSSTDQDPEKHQPVSVSPDDESVDIKKTNKRGKRDFSNLAFYISSMGKISFFIFVFLVGAEVVLTAMQRQYRHRMHQSAINKANSSSSFMASMVGKGFPSKFDFAPWNVARCVCSFWGSRPVFLGVEWRVSTNENSLMLCEPGKEFILTMDQLLSGIHHPEDIEKSALQHITCYHAVSAHGTSTLLYWHAKSLTISRAPMNFFASMDTGAIINRFVRRLAEKTLEARY